MDHWSLRYVDHWSLRYVRLEEDAKGAVQRHTRRNLLHQVAEFLGPVAEHAVALVDNDASLSRRRCRDETIVVETQSDREGLVATAVRRRRGLVASSASNSGGCQGMPPV